MTKASNNEFPSILFAEEDPPSAPSTGFRRLFLNASNVNVIGSNSSVRALAWSDAVGGSGDVATDAIWDAAGDLAVGSGANTAAKLGIGAAGGALSVINSAVAWNSGTSFPANKATGDRYWRTDLGLEFYWDGTRWVTTQLFVQAVVPPTASITNIADSDTESTQARAVVPLAASDIYIVGWDVTTYVGATNNGSNYWFVRLKWATAAVSITQLGQVNTSGDTQANYAYHYEAIGSVLTNTAVIWLMSIQDSGSPGTILVSGANVYYRIVGT